MLHLPNKFDLVVAAAAVAGPLTAMPQILAIWSGASTAGVSAPSWLLFAALSGLWLVHAVRRRDWLFALSSMLWIAADLGVVVSIALRTASVVAAPSGSDRWPLHRTISVTGTESWADQAACRIARSTNHKPAGEEAGVTR